MIMSLNIYGIGTDIVQTSRIAKIYNKYHNKFIERILTAEEISILNQRNNKINYIAKRFAAKEALSKALKRGIGEKISFKDISVLNDKNGAPYFTVSKKLQKFIDNLNIEQLHLSLSDESDYVVGFVISIFQSGN